jgi:hypothetical protein
MLEGFEGPHLPHSPPKPLLSSSPSSFQRRRHSDPILLPSTAPGEFETSQWQTSFGGTPVEENIFPESRPRSRTLQALPGSLPSVRERVKPSMAIGQKKSKLPARRLSLPPILEADQIHESLSPTSQKQQQKPSLSASPSPTQPLPTNSTLYTKFFRWGKT